MEFIDVIVSRLFLVLGERLEVVGAAGVSLFPDLPLESHEKLIPSFFGNGSGTDDVESFAFDVGEGPQGMDGKFPDRPLVFGGGCMCEVDKADSSSFWLRLRISDEDLIEDDSAPSLCG